MFFFKQILSIIALLGFLASPALAAETFSGKADYTALNSSGKVVVLANSSTQTALDVADGSGIDERDDRLVEAALQLGVFRFFADYRYLDIEVDDSVVVTDTSFSGPYAGALVRF